MLRHSENRRHCLEQYESGDGGDPEAVRLPTVTTRKEFAIIFPGKFTA